MAVTKRGRADLWRLALSGLVAFGAGFAPWGAVPVGRAHTLVTVNAWQSDLGGFRIGLPSWTAPLAGLAVVLLALATLYRFFLLSRGSFLVLSMVGGLHTTAFLAYLVVKGSVRWGVIVAFCAFLAMQLQAWGLRPAASEPLP